MTDILTQGEVDDLLESMLSRFDPQELEALCDALDRMDLDHE